MEQWRMQETKRMKTFYLFLAAVALGGCGIWSMHFTGMNALQMRLNNGMLLEVDFELGLTILSFIFAVAGVFIGLKIASTDPFFLEIEQARRKEILVGKQCCCTQVVTTQYLTMPMNVLNADERTQEDDDGLPRAQD